MKEHDWKYVGHKHDRPEATTHYLWSCPGCGAKVTTSGAYLEGEHFWESHSPAPEDLRGHDVDEDCLLQLVTSVHER